MNALVDHLEKIQSFVTIAEIGSIQGAASHLHISQPALSLKLKTLEEALGGALFVRSKSGVELTKAGQNLYSFGKKLLDDIEHLSLMSDEPKQHLRIGTFDVIVNMIASRLHREKPSRDVTFRTGVSALAQLEGLTKDEIDLAIVDDPPMIPGLSYRKLVPSPFVFCAAKSVARRLAGRKVVGPDALRKFALIYVPTTTSYARASEKKLGPKTMISSLLDDLGCGASRRIRVDSHSVCIELVRQGLGIGLCLVGHVLDHLDTGALVEIQTGSGLMPMSSTLYIAYKSRGDQSKLESEIKLIEAIFKDAVARYQSMKCAPR